MSKLSGKIAVITGGNGALGKVVTERFLSEGAAVIVALRNKINAERFISEMEKRFPLFQWEEVDCTSEVSVRNFYNTILKKHPRVDILCNLVGGVSPKKYIEDLSLVQWEGMISLNLKSCFLMSRESVRLMKMNGYGRIINIAAKAAVTPEAQRGGYGIAKAGVVALTKMMGEEVKGHNDITVNAIAPSIITTEENKSWGSAADVPKWVTPHQIASMMIHLCSDEGKAVNGQIIQMYGKV